MGIGPYDELRKIVSVCDECGEYCLSSSVRVNSLSDILQETGHGG